MAQMVGCNENGIAVGEDHHHAKLSDREVDLIRELYEQGEALPLGERIRRGLTMPRLAVKFGVSKKTVRDIINCRIRAQVPVRWRRVKDEQHTGGDTS